jgi:hypothetical protein
VDDTFIHSFYLEGKTKVLTGLEIKKTIQLVKAHEAALFLRISKQRLYELCRRNILPPGVVVRFGPRQLRFNLQKLREFVENGGGATGGKENND